MSRNTLIAMMLSIPVLGAGCAVARPAPPAVGPEDAWASMRAEWEAAARDSAERGDHLGASRYLEAALAAGGDERRLLPLLAAAQIRAGRLRAARESVACLEALDPDRPGLADLDSLLDALIHPATAVPAAASYPGGGR